MMTSLRIFRLKSIPGEAWPELRQIISTASVSPDLVLECFCVPEGRGEFDFPDNFTLTPFGARRTMFLSSAIQKNALSEGYDDLIL
jgi:hypothetical protein